MDTVVKPCLSAVVSKAKVGDDGLDNVSDESDSGVSDVEGICKERNSVGCAGLSIDSEYNCTGECGCEFYEEETEDWLEELRERLGLEQEDPYLLQVRRPQVPTQSRQRNVSRLAKSKLLSSTVSSVKEAAAATVVLMLSLCRLLS